MIRCTDYTLREDFFNCYSLNGFLHRREVNADKYQCNAADMEYLDGFAQKQGR